MSGPDGGRLDVLVRSRGADIDSVELHLRRPLEVLAGLHGKYPDECLRLLPLLFPLCGRAHALAALAALEAAVGVAPSPAHLPARETLATADALAAQVWRTCIDWAQLLKQPVDASNVARARRLGERIALALYPDGDWRRLGGGRLAPDPTALASARDELDALRTDFLLADRLSRVRQRLADALAGTSGDWLTRLDQRFVAMADATVANFSRLDSQLQVVPVCSEVSPIAVEPMIAIGHGSGSVETARGSLGYEFDLADAKVERCMMVAPTDRVFADNGPVAQQLRSLKRADDPLRAVGWIVAAFDPCIEVGVTATGVS